MVPARGWLPHSISAQKSGPQSLTLWVDFLLEEGQWPQGLYEWDTLYLVTV
jgi:hypothetical protein